MVVAEESHMKQTKMKRGVDATDDELMAWGENMGLLLVVYLS